MQHGSLLECIKYYGGYGDCVTNSLFFLGQFKKSNPHLAYGYFCSNETDSEFHSFLLFEIIPEIVYLFDPSRNIYFFAEKGKQLALSKTTLETVFYDGTSLSTYSVDGWGKFLIEKDPKNMQDIFVGQFTETVKDSIYFQKGRNKVTFDPQNNKWDLKSVKVDSDEKSHMNSSGLKKFLETTKQYWISESWFLNKVSGLICISFCSFRLFSF
jgi:hypothetical protein